MTGDLSLVEQSIDRNRRQREYLLSKRNGTAQDLDSKSYRDDYTQNSVPQHNGFPAGAEPDTEDEEDRLAREERRRLKKERKKAKKQRKKE